MMKLPNLSLERALRVGRVCGVDEAGRGPWAGPVVAAAVVLDPSSVPPGLNDSKKLTPAARRSLCDALQETAEIGVGIVDVAQIDRLNILNATHIAMRIAIRNLAARPDHALIDGTRVPPDLICPATGIVRGDARSQSIAAASIIAKVTRDRIMVALSQQFPGYEWHKNAGYGVPAHLAGLQSLGVTPHHRRSFKPIHKMLCEVK